MKVLIIRLSAMGDIIHGLPAAALLKERLPNLELSWLAEPAGIPLLEGNPAVDRVIVFPKRKWLQQLRSVPGTAATAAEALRFIKELRSLQFDAALDLQGLFKSSLLGFLSGAHLRFGFKGTREGAERLLSHALDVGDYFAGDTHVVDLNLRLAAEACRVLSPEPSDTEKTGASPSFICKSARFPLPAPPLERSAAVRELLPLSAQKDSPLIALIPGTTWDTKIWASEKWAELAALCLSSMPCRLVLLGSEAEQEMNARIAYGLGNRVTDLSAKTQIADLISIFQETDIVVGADTGPLHLAAAVGKARVLAIFGSTPPQRNGPYGSQCSVLSLKLDCQPCFQKACPLGTLACLKDLDVKTVFAELLNLAGSI